MNYIDNIISKDVKRLDIVTTFIRYKSCYCFDNTMSCFRFKNVNRQEDIEMMKKLVDEMYLPNFENKNFVKYIYSKYNVSLSIIEQDVTYAKTCAKKCFILVKNEKKK